MLQIGKFRNSGRPRAGACFLAKARLMRVTSWQKDKHEKTAAELPENEENLKGLMFRWAPNLLIGLRNHCYVQQKEDSSSSLAKTMSKTRNCPEEWVSERVQ